MIRHADRDEDSGEFYALGVERAKALVTVVRDMGVTVIYSSDVRRNLDTSRLG